MRKKLFTSEAVTEGHPDKVCDRISDSVLDAVLAEDPQGRVACETCCTTGLVVMMGEVSAKALIDYSKIARKSIVEIGYDRPELGFDGNTCNVIVAIDSQSPDIALGTNDSIGGAGDQGMMFGFACDETPDLMPLPISIANRLAYRLAKVRKEGIIKGIRPDGKTQVTIGYDEYGIPSEIDTILISTQHEEYVTSEWLRKELMEHVVKPVLIEASQYGRGLSTEPGSFRFLVNPTGRFVYGGPAADSGLTGRKIIADTYGGYGAHGGGAFSGKDPTKVDRSAAYAARHIAKNIVAAGIANRCQIQLAYAIGMPKPVSIRVDTFGTSAYGEGRICDAVEKVFDLTPQGIINRLDLRRPIYKGTSSYGHFGLAKGEDRPWERLDACEKLKEVLGMDR